jgi:hypothetical protein
LQQIRKRLTYANVMSSIAVFLVLGGATAFAATQLGKNSVGSKQLKSNAVTAAKIKKNAVTGAKIKKNAVTGAKIKKNAVTEAKIKNGAVTGAKIPDGAITGSKVNTSTLGTVPVSATTNSVRSTHGTLLIGQEKTIFEYGPFKITTKCAPYNSGTEIGSQSLISSSVDSSVFTSWMDNNSHLGPATPESERELSGLNWQNSAGPFNGEPPFDTGGSASAPTGQAFNVWIGEATELDTNTCWYWLTANIIS